MSVPGAGPPPKVALDFGKSEDFDVPTNMEDVQKCLAIKQQMDQVRAQPWFSEFMLKYPKIQGPISEFYRKIDGMAQCGEAINKDFASIIKKHQMVVQGVK